MADPNLTESAWQRAKEDAAGVYPTTGFHIGGALVTLIAGSIAAVASADGATSIQIAIPVLGGAVALGMSFLAVLAFQLVAAPVRQRNDLRGAWPSSSGQPDNLKAKLWNAYRKGVDLQARLEDQPALKTSYVRRIVEEWSEETGGLLAEGVPVEDSQRFFTEGQFLATQADVVEERTKALKEIIEGLE